MQITRRFTNDQGGSCDPIAFVARDCDLIAPDGEPAGQVRITLPEGMGRDAAHAFLRHALCPDGVPSRLRPVAEPGVPAFLWRHVADDEALAALPRSDRFGPETDARQVHDRLSGAWAYHGWKAGLFDTAEDARAYRDEMRAMLARQMGAPEPALWARTGLDWAYGLSVPALPRAPASVILSGLPAADEVQSDGTAAPGLLARIEALDRTARAEGRPDGALTAECAIDHPEIAALITWRHEALRRDATLAAGDAAIAEASDAIARAARAGADPDANPALRRALVDARQRRLPDSVIAEALDRAAQGIGPAAFHQRTEGAPRLRTALRVGDAFLRALAQDKAWPLTGRRDGRILRRVPARDLWHAVTDAAWRGAAPQILFHDVIEAWNTCPLTAPAVDPIAPPKATLALRAFLRDGRIDDAALAHAACLWTLTLEITRGMDPLPDQAPALALGHADLPALLMAMGLAHDSPEGRACAAAVTAIITASAYATSARIAALQGPFASSPQNAPAMLRVIANHRAAAHGARCLGVATQPLEAAHCPDPDLARRARAAWDEALDLGRAHGFRHAAVTALGVDATTATLLDGAVAATRHLRHAGWRGDRPAPWLLSGLRALGHDDAAIAAMMAHASGHRSLTGCPHVNAKALARRGIDAPRLARIEAALAAHPDLTLALTPWTLGTTFCRQHLGLTPDQMAQPDFDLLAHLGFTPSQIAEAQRHIAGSGTLRCAPSLPDAHAAVFDDAPPEARLRMMAAMQAFVSGRIEAPLTLPATTDPAAIGGLLTLARDLGLQAVTLARDTAGLGLPVLHALPPDPEAQPAAPPRPVLRHAIIEGHRATLRIRLDPQGAPQDLSLDLRHPDPAMRAMATGLAAALSVGLRHAVPLPALLEGLTRTSRPESGDSAILDVLARELSALTERPKRARRPAPASMTRPPERQALRRHMP